MRLVALCCTLLATTALAADFEGVITGKPTKGDPDKPGLDSMKMFLAPAGWRMEATGEAGGKGKGKDKGDDATPFRMTVIWRAAEPGVTYFLNEDSKAYMKHDLKKDKPEDGEKAPTVEKLGKTTFLGRSVERVKVTFEQGRTQELWVDTSLKFPAAALASLSSEQGARNSSWKALEKAGVGGIPLKEINPDGSSGWEATKVEKKSLPASLFQVPADFHQAKDPLDMAPPGKQDSLRKQRDEAMKNMTPEQRQKLEEMMKKYQQQGN